MALRTPTGLKAKAKALWKDTTESFDLRTDELRILEDACREVDLIERLETELKGSPLMVEGSMGQLVASPLVQELRQHRTTLKSLLAALKLPEDDAGSKGTRATSARAAAEARWRVSGS